MQVLLNYLDLVLIIILFIKLSLTIQKQASFGKSHQFPMVILPLLTSTMELLLCISDYVCYFGSSLSGVIAWRMVKMENLTILNKMLLIYFSLDFVFGTIETYLLSKLYRERLQKKLRRV